MNSRSKIRPMREVTEIRDGMAIDWDIPIEMDDGLILRADVYRPTAPGRYPVILSYGPYAKWLAFQDGYSTAWEIMIKEHPDVLAGSSNTYQSWEVVDPEKWVPDGYVCLRIDSRGAGRSPGYIDPFSPRETQDIYHAIEWAARQSWSSGKIGMNGVSYYAINAWQVASLQPPQLAAICVWEGAGDWYRDKNHQGGILCTFQANWYDMQVKTVQHGLGQRGPRSRFTGDLVCGPETLSDKELRKFRCDFGETIYAHPLDDAYHRARSADWSKITVPLLSAGNWGGNGLHLRGNIEGFVRAASKQKWLEVHGDRHWTLFYTDYGIDLQKRFFGYFLKGEDTGWDRQPRVLLQIRHPGEKFVAREENEWPLARTRWTKFYLDPAGLSLSQRPAGGSSKVEYEALGDGLTFLTPPLDNETEVTGPSAAKLFVSSSTIDADLFLALQVFAPDGKEVVFQGALDPHSPIGQGWLRASHRQLDPKLNTPYRPYHTHAEKRPLEPGEVVELDVEIWPTCIVIPPGYRIGLQVRGKDYVYKGASGGRLSNMKNEFTGCGPFLHDDPRDRSPETSGGRITLHSGPGMQPYLLLPIIPPKNSERTVMADKGAVAKATPLTPGAKRAGPGEYYFDMTKVNSIMGGPDYSNVFGGVVEGERMIAALMRMPAGGGSVPHSHPNEQWVYVLEGTMDSTVDGQRRLVKPGEAIYIPANVVHCATATAEKDVIFFTVKDASHGLHGIRHQG